MKREYFKNRPENFERFEYGVCLRLDIIEDNSEDLQSFSALEFFISFPLTEK